MGSRGWARQLAGVAGVGRGQGREGAWLGLRWTWAVITWLARSSPSLSAKPEELPLIFISN